MWTIAAREGTGGARVAAELADVDIDDAQLFSLVLDASRFSPERLGETLLAAGGVQAGLARGYVAFRGRPLAAASIAGLTGWYAVSPAGAAVVKNSRGGY